MKCKIMHESRGRMRIRMMQKRMTLEQADILEYYLRAADGVTDVKVYDRTCDAVVFFCEENRDQLLDALRAFSYESSADLVPDHTGRELNRQFEDRLVLTVLARAASKMFLPAPVRIGVTAIKSAGYLKKGLASLMRGKIEVSVLDATAISVSMLHGDWDTAAESGRNAGGMDPQKISG